MLDTLMNPDAISQIIITDSGNRVTIVENSGCRLIWLKPSPESVARMWERIEAEGYAAESCISSRRRKTVSYTLGRRIASV